MRLLSLAVSGTRSAATARFPLLPWTATAASAATLPAITSLACLPVPVPAATAAALAALVLSGRRAARGLSDSSERGVCGRRNRCTRARSGSGTGTSRARWGARTRTGPRAGARTRTTRECRLSSSLTPRVTAVRTRAGARRGARGGWRARRTMFPAIASPAARTRARAAGAAVV
jgi:hypothetical protein